jgi:hypothetical protein
MGKGEALVMRARLRSAQGRIDKSVFEEGISLLEQSGNLFTLAKAYYHYAECLLVSGAKDDAKGNLKKAEKIFKKMGARFWAERVKRMKGA